MQLCPTGLNMQTLEWKAQIGEKDMSTLSKLRETRFTTFTKYNGDSKQGQAWCAAVCFHGMDYKVETIATEDVKFAIFGAIEMNLQARVLHLHCNPTSSNFPSP